MEDLIGQQFGKLTVIERQDIIKDNKRVRKAYLCQCSCGNSTVTREDALKSGKTNSCGCGAKEKIRNNTDKKHIGKKYGHLTVLYRESDSLKFRCLCDCGRETSVFINNVVTGHIVACGCGGDGYIDLTGQTFGRWTVLGKSEKRLGKKQIIGWDVVCSCGNTSVVSTSNLKQGISQSCGKCDTKIKIPGESKKLQQEEIYESLVNNVYGNLTVVEYLGRDENDKGVFRCECSCGNSIVLTYKKLHYIRSCGCKSKKFIDLTGQIFNRWTVLEFSGYNEFYNSVWLCRCSCGEEREVLGYQLRDGVSKSCGCYHHDELVVRNTTHGQSKTREYRKIKATRRRDNEKLNDSEWTLEMELAIRDLYNTCVLCDMTESEHWQKYNKSLHVDHVRPLSLGFGLKPGNAVLLCQSCNSSKGNKDLDELPEEDRIRLLQAAKFFQNFWESECEPDYNELADEYYEDDEECE